MCINSNGRETLITVKLERPTGQSTRVKWKSLSCKHTSAKSLDLISKSNEKLQIEY